MRASNKSFFVGFTRTKKGGAEWETQSRQSKKKLSVSFPKRKKKKYKSGEKVCKFVEGNPFILVQTNSRVFVNHSHLEENT
jgi:hypothetical protein